MVSLVPNHNINSVEYAANILVWTDCGKSFKYVRQLFVCNTIPHQILLKKYMFS